MNDNRLLTTEQHLALRRQEAARKANRNAAISSVKVNRRDWLDYVVRVAMLLDTFIDRVRNRRYLREVDRVMKQSGLE